MRQERIQLPPGVTERDLAQSALIDGGPIILIGYFPVIQSGGFWRRDLHMWQLYSNMAPGEFFAFATKWMIDNQFMDEEFNLNPFASGWTPPPASIN